MSEAGVILVVIAIVAVVAMDIIVRLVIAPHRRDKYLEDLFDSLTEAEPMDQMSRDPHASAALDDSLAESLLRHFEQSATSRHVLAALSSQSDGMRESELLAAVNRELAHSRKRELPAGVVRRVMMILMGADLTALREGRLELTTTGRRLHALLQARSPARALAPAFVSR